MVSKGDGELGVMLSRDGNMMVWKEGGSARLRRDGVGTHLDCHWSSSLQNGSLKIIWKYLFFNLDSRAKPGSVGYYYIKATPHWLTVFSTVSVIAGQFLKPVIELAVQENSVTTEQIAINIRIQFPLRPWMLKKPVKKKSFARFVVLTPLKHGFFVTLYSVLHGK